MKGLPFGLVHAPDGVDGEPIQYDAAQSDFLRAMEEYQRLNSHRYPAYTEVLAVAISLGYRRVADPVPLPRLYRRGAVSLERDSDERGCNSCGNVD